MNAVDQDKFLSLVSEALGRVGYKGRIAMDDYFKRDLKIDSIDLVEMAFQIEKISGLKINFIHFVLNLQDTQLQGYDFPVRALVDHLSRLNK